MRHLFVFFLCVFPLFGADYDCIFVGTSPISLFEALYQHASGKSVLLLDEAPSCGGVWKSIEICGVEHVDVGCHEIGNSSALKEFLEEYGGCKMVSCNSPQSFYFSGGCYELIRNLERRIANTSIRLLLNHRVDRARYDSANQCVIVDSNGEQFTAKKIYTCTYSYFATGSDASRTVQKTKYYHLYLLIADPTPPRFAYQSHGVAGTSRMMNLTHCNNLAPMGRQLIVFQTHNTDLLSRADKFLEELKTRNLIDSSAYLLTAEPYIYEQWPYNRMQTPTNFGQSFEQLNTADFRGIITHVSRWKQLLAPYAQAVGP